MAYLCMRNGEECGFTASEFRTAQNEGWEKQYPYKVGKKKVYMTPPAAEAPGRQASQEHPIWPSESYLCPLEQRGTACIMAGGMG